MTTGQDHTSDSATEQLEAMGRTFALDTYRLLRLTRAVDEALGQLHRAGTIGFHVPWALTEATTVGAVTALNPDDWVFPSHRFGGVALSRGIEAETLFHHALATADDPSLGRQTPGNFSHAEAHIVSISSSPSARLTQAAGVAHAAHLRGEDCVPLAYLGAAATACNDFHAGLNLAGVLKAPVIFLAERKGAEDAPAGTVAPFGEAYGIQAMSIDGSDVLSVRAAVLSARRKITEGSGPILIDAARGGDPIERFRRTLKGVGGLSPSLLAELDDGITVEVEDALRAAMESRPAAHSTLHDHVLADRSSEIEKNPS